MSNFSVSSNHFLRQLYTGNRELSSGSERLKVSTKDLAKADTKALKKGIASLSDYDYEKETEDPVEFYKTLKAFADTYNQTVETGGKLMDDSDTKRLMNEMKKLRQNHADELDSYGISFDSKGFMSISETAMDNISVNRFKDILGEDSEFLRGLSDIQKKLSRRIDYLV